MRAPFARLVSPPRVPLDPVHRASDRADAAILPAPLRVPRCSRILSVAPPPPAGSAPNTVSLPLAVPFLQSVSCFTVSFLGFTPLELSAATTIHQRTDPTPSQAVKHSTQIVIPGNQVNGHF